VEADPNDPARHNYLAQATVFHLMYKSGALESEMVTGGNPFLRRPKMNPTPEEDRRFFGAINRSLELTGERLRRNPKDADATYAQGVALGLRGNYHYLVRKAWMDALRDITAGRKLHNQLTELEPGRADARLIQGIHDYIVGSLPLIYKMLGFLAGFRGDREQGIRILQRVAREGRIARVDAEILLATVYRRERRPKDAIPLCLDLAKRFPRNFLVLFELSQMYADLGDKTKAIEALDRIEHLKAAGAPGFRTLPGEKVSYARGNLLFWYREPAAAVPHLQKAAAKAAELDPNTGVMAFLRLGQCLDLLGGRSEALAAYRQAIAYAPESEAARDARKHLGAPYRRP
jgi:tetratricopeptide (TPR) repeat protein